MNDAYLYQTATCGECGTRFYCDNREDWVYTRSLRGKKYIFCKWSCMRAFDEKHPKRKNAQTRLSMGFTRSGK